MCVPCARAVFGDSWCSLVLRRWARAAGFGGAKVDALLGFARGSVSAPGVSVSSASVLGSVPVSVSGSSSSSPSSVSARGSVSVRSASVGGGRVGVGFGARVGVGFGARVRGLGRLGGGWWWCGCLVGAWLLVGGSALWGGRVVWFLVLV